MKESLLFLRNAAVSTSVVSRLGDDSSSRSTNDAI